MPRQRKTYPIGSGYTVIEAGIRRRGLVTRIDDEGYYVEWSDGKETLESFPDPTVERYEDNCWKPTPH